MLAPDAAADGDGLGCRSAREAAPTGPARADVAARPAEAGLVVRARLDHRRRERAIGVSVPWATILSPTATFARVGAETPRTEYFVADETSTVTVLPAVVVTTIVVAVLLATVPWMEDGEIVTAVA